MSEIKHFMEFTFEEAVGEIQLRDLMDYTLGGSWDKVVEMYQNHKWTHAKRINDSRDTALHIAVDNCQEKTVKQLVDAIVHEEGKRKPPTSAIAIKNVRGDTPLHLAASRGFAKICYCIVGEKKERAHLLRETNENGENPLFLAALNRHKEAFLYLDHCFSPITSAELSRKDGDTILHCAIQREYFDLAVIIIHLHKELIGCQNKNGVTPLKTLATKPLAFKSSSNLGWLNELLYRCILVEQVDVDTATKSPPDSALKIDVQDDTHKHHPENYETCYRFVWKLLNIAGLNGFFPKKQQGDIENPKTQQEGDIKNPKTQAKNQKLRFLPPNYETFWEFLKFLKSLYASAAGLSGLDLSRVKGMKEKHVWSAQVLDFLMAEPSYAYRGGSGSMPALEGGFPDFRETRRTNNQGEDKEKTNSQDTEKTNDEDKGEKGKKTNSQDKGKTNDEDEIDKSDSPLLIAARYVESRQPVLLETLRKQGLWGNLILGLDTQENTVLHLAARQSKYRAWQIPGSFMQMIWDIKWYQYIEDLVLPHHFHLQPNQEGKTPPEIFEKEHVDLVEEGSEWLKDTSQSCSVVAALIAGVAFATSSTIPGGNNEKTGKPNYEGQPVRELTCRDLHMVA